MRIATLLQWRLVSIGTLLGTLTVGTACTTTKPVETDKVVQPVANNKIDDNGWCRIKFQIDEAAQRGQRLAERQKIAASLADNLRDTTTQFAAIWALDDEQERWRSFRELQADTKSAHVGYIGECLTYLDWGILDQAKVPCEKVEKLYPQGLGVVAAAQGNYALNHGDLTEATSFFETAGALAPDCAASFVGKAQVLEKQNAPLEAAAAWGRARELAQTCLLCAKQEARLVEKHRSEAEAIPLWEATLSIAPSDAEALEHYARAQSGRDDEKALAAYERAFASGRSTVLARRQAAAIAYRAGNFAAAATHWAVVTEEEPKNLDAWRALAESAQKAGKPDVAKNAYVEVLDLFPDDVSAHFILGKMELHPTSGNPNTYAGFAHYHAAIRVLDGNKIDAKTETKTDTKANTKSDTKTDASKTTGSDAVSTASTDAKKTIDAPSLSDEQIKELRGEYASIIAEFAVIDPAPAGSVEKVVGDVKNRAQRLLARQKKAQPALKGELDVSVATDAKGNVVDVVVKNDSLGDALIRVSTMCSLLRAKIDGGDRRYNFKMSFK